MFQKLFIFVWPCNGGLAFGLCWFYLFPQSESIDDGYSFYTWLVHLYEWMNWYLFCFVRFVRFHGCHEWIYNFWLSVGWACGSIPLRSEKFRRTYHRALEQCLRWCELIAMIAGRIFDAKCGQNVNSFANIVSEDFRNHTIWWYTSALIKVPKSHFHAALAANTWVDRTTHGSTGEWTVNTWTNF